MVLPSQKYSQFSFVFCMLYNLNAAWTGLLTKYSEFDLYHTSKVKFKRMQNGQDQLWIDFSSWPPKKKTIKIWKMCFRSLETNFTQLILFLENNIYGAFNCLREVSLSHPVKSANIRFVWTFDLRQNRLKEQCVLIYT